MDAGVVEALIEGPRQDRRHIAPRGTRPDGGPHAVRRDDRHVPGHRAVGQLIGFDVAQPSAEHARDVVQERRCRAEDLDVAGPAGALVALRTVGGDVDEVAAHPPHDVVVQLLHVGVRGGEPPGALEVGVQNAGDEGAGGDIGVEVARPPVDLDVPEAVEGEPGLPFLHAAPGEGVVVARARRAQRTCVDLAVLQHLGGAQAHGRAGRPGNAQAHAARDVLSEVEDAGAARRGEHLDRPPLLGAAHGRGGGCHEGRRVTPAHRGLLPGGVVEAGGAPSVVLEPRVVVFAVVNAGAQDRRGGGAPRAVRRDRLATAVGVGDLELSEEGEVLAEDVAEALVPADASAIPAVAQPRADGVLSRCEKVGDVVGVIPQARVVGGPPRGEGVVADAAAVEFGLVESVR